MLNLPGKRASILPPTLPKSRFNPVTKIIAYPVKVVIESFVRQSSLAIQPVSAADLIAMERRRQQQQEAIQVQLGHPRRMNLQGFAIPYDPILGGAGRGIDPRLGVNGGVPGVPIEGMVPGDMVTLPVEPPHPSGFVEPFPDLPLVGPGGLPPDTLITETDTEEEIAISLTPPVAPAPKITTQIADQVISGVLPVTPDATQIVVPAPISPALPRPGPPAPVVPVTPAPIIPTGPPTYTFKDISGHVVFNIENKSMNTMPLTVLVSARIGDHELIRVTKRTRLMPLKTRQFRAAYILEGDQSELVRSIKGDLTGGAFPEAVNVTVDAVIQWHLFRNSVSQTLAVPLETEATF